MATKHPGIHEHSASRCMKQESPRAGDAQPAPHTLSARLLAGQCKADGRAENDEANQDRDHSKHGFKRFRLG